MKAYLASLLLCLAAATANAQSLPYGITLGDLKAVRDATGVSVITGSLVNHGTQHLQRLSVTFVLYNAQGQEVGRIFDRFEGPLAPGQVWQIRTTTPEPFARFSALGIRVD